MQPMIKTLSTLARKNVEHVVQLRAFFETRIGRSQKRIERVAAWLGQPRTLSLLGGACLGWVAYNGWLFRYLGVQLDPPPFMWLQGALCLYGAMVATMVLSAQNRRNSEAEQRAHLQLQIDLVTEQKTTKIIALLEELRRDMPSVRNREDPSVRELLERVDPAHLVSVLEGFSRDDVKDPSKEP